jgi:hypothetical protein
MTGGVVRDISPQDVTFWRSGAIALAMVALRLREIKASFSSARS